MPYREKFDSDLEDSLEMSLDSAEMQSSRGTKTRRDTSDKTALQELYGLLLGILETIQTSSKRNVRKARERELVRSAVIY